MLKKVIYLIPENQKNKVLTALLLFIIISCLEFVSLGSIIPLISFSLDDTHHLNTASVFFGYEYEVESFKNKFVYAIVFLFIFKNIFVALSNYFVNLTTLKIQSELRELVLDKISKMEILELVNENNSTFLSMVQHWTGHYQNTLSAYLKIVFSSALLIAVSGIVIINQPNSAIFIISLFMISIAMYYVTLRRSLKKLGAEENLLQSNIIERVSIFLDSQIEQRVYNASNYLKLKVRKVLERNAYIKAKIGLINSSPRHFLEIVAVSFLAYLLNSNIAETANHTADLFGLSVLMLVAAFKVIPVLNELLRAFSSVRHSHSAIDDLYNLIQKRTSASPSLSKRSRTNIINVMAENLSFIGSKGTNNLCYNGVFTVKEGQCIAIVGSSGVGKTKFIEMIIGLFPYSAGTIRSNGSVVTNLLNTNIKISYAKQNPLIFNGSLGENITLSHKVDNQKLMESIKFASLNDELIGSENVIKFVNRSGGEKQRVGLARAFYHDSDIYFFDEPFSALDLDTASDIIKSLSKLKHAGKTIIVVTHSHYENSIFDGVYRINKDFIQKVEG